MSAKAKKSTSSTSFTSQSTSGMETPGSSSFSTRRRERPPSPARATRQQEQEDLQGLNDRLANYIDRVRYLEAENSRLNTQVQSTEEVVKREVSSVKSLYETELGDARRLLDETAKEKARIQIEANKYKTDFEDLLTKFKQRDGAASAAERRVEALEAQVAELTTKLNEADGPRKRLEKDNAALKAEIAKLEKQLSTSKQQTEEETLLRVDLENRVQSLKEDLHFKSQLFEQELEESRVRTSTQIDEVDNQLEQEYEQRLLDALREIRAQHDADLHTVRNELETLYENKVWDLKAQLDRSSSTADGAWEELSTTRKHCDQLTAELNRLKAENAGLDLRLRDLEAQLTRERAEWALRVEQKDEEIVALRTTLDQQMAEYSDLLNIKIRLDREIEAYRKLLESEETRLNISLDSSQSSQTSRSPGRSTPSGRGAKRKRGDLAEEEYSEKSSSSGYARSASAKGGLDITEVDDQGKWIKLTNTTAKDIAVGSWQLKHVAGQQETVFKFHHSVVLKAGTTVTVWSADSEGTHSPPSDMLMKGKRWFVADDMNTTLFNNDEEEMATCSLSKSTLRSVTTYSQRRSGPSHMQDSGEGVEREKCVVM